MGISQTILVVEDEIIVLVDIADFLRGCGFNVIEATNAAQAMAIIESGAPIDIVFSDIQMPGSMDGLGLANWIRYNRPDLTFILASGRAEALELAADVCAHMLLSKPYDCHHLVDLFTTLGNHKAANPPKCTN